MKRTIKDTDNRDIRTTILILDNGDTVEVDPVALLENALDNMGDDGEINDYPFNALKATISQL